MKKLILFTAIALSDLALSHSNGKEDADIIQSVY